MGVSQEKSEEEQGVSHILWALCHRDSSGCKSEPPHKGSNLQLSLKGWLAPSSWEKSLQRWKQAPGKWQRGWKHKYTLASTARTPLDNSRLRGANSQQCDERRRSLSASRQQVLCHGHQQDNEQEK